MPFILFHFAARCPTASCVTVEVGSTVIVCDNLMPLFVIYPSIEMFRFSSKQLLTTCNKTSIELCYVVVQT